MNFRRIDRLDMSARPPASLSLFSLQPCLGGDGKTLMFVNVNPEAESLQESICSLRFATKVNACQTAARGGAKRHVSMIGESSRGSMQVNFPLIFKHTAPP